MSRRPWLGLPAALALIGCAGAEQKDVSEGGSDGAVPQDSGEAEPAAGPSAYEAPAAEAPAPLSLDVLQMGLDRGLSAIVSARPAELHAAQHDAMAHPEGPCPGLFASVGFTTAWSNDCATRAGWAFSGRAQAAWLSNLTVDGVLVRQYGEFITTATYTHPGGAALQLDGRGELRLVEGAAGSSYAASLVGTFGYTPSATAWRSLPWLEGAPSFSLSWQGEDAVGGGRWLELEGGSSGGDAVSEGILGLRAEGLRVERAGPDGDCSATGALVLLGERGDRYRLALDGPCEACGPLLGPDGAALGEVCPDLSPLLGGEERPW